MDEMDWACGTYGEEKGMHRESAWVSLKSVAIWKTWRNRRNKSKGMFKSRPGRAWNKLMRIKIGTNSPL